MHKMIGNLGKRRNTFNKKQQKTTKRANSGIRKFHPRLGKKWRKLENHIIENYNEEGKRINDIRRVSEKPGWNLVKYTIHTSITLCGAFRRECTRS